MDLEGRNTNGDVEAWLRLYKEGCSYCEDPLALRLSGEAIDYYYTRGKEHGEENVMLIGRYSEIRMILMH